MSFLSGDSLPVIGSLKESCKKFSDKLDEMGLAS